MQGGTHLTAPGIVFLLAMAVLTFSLPRRLALVPVFLSSCYMTLAQVVSIGGLHFTLLRIVMLLGWVRVLSRREHLGFQLNDIDRAVLRWAAACFVMGFILVPDAKGFQYELGEVYNALGLYFLMRVHLREAADLTSVLKALVWALLPLSLLMIGEHQNGHNIFGALGGVMETSVSRGDNYRAQGPFAHSILAGTVGAFMMPLFLSLWSAKESRLLALIGVIVGTTMMLASHSSGPFMSYLGVLAAIALWPMRSKMRAFRWGFVAFLLLLQCVMKTPIWFLMAKIAELIGGDGYQRAVVMDQAIRRVNEWWLCGTTKTAHWYPSGVLYTNPDQLDITNEFVNQAVAGGMLRLALFIVIIIGCYREVGRSLRREKYHPFAVWLRGCALIANVVAFFSVSYFDQIDVFWFFAVALVSCGIPTASSASVTDQVEVSGMNVSSTVEEVPA
jgi:uncharacterized membrane protein YeaQ/YmgE (transglycosylase-associated protein family)